MGVDKVWGLSSANDEISRPGAFPACDEYSDAQSLT